jgi:hypothetical protein
MGEDIVKPGYRTTEWWGKNMAQFVTIAAMLVSAFGLSLTTDQISEITKFGLLVVGLVESSYAVSRGFAKKK